MTNIEVIDIEIYRGDDTTIVLSVTDNNDNPINFNGSEISMLIKPKRGESYLLELNNGIEILNNDINIIFDHELTKDWDFKNAKYDIQIIDSSGKYKTIVKGNILITKDITP